MAVGARWAAGMWTRSLNRGCLISVHAQEPDAAGRGALLAGPSFAGTGIFRVSGTVAINGRALEIDQAGRGGRARWIGLWTAQLEFVTSLPLRRDRQIVAGQPVVIPRGGIRLELTS